MAEVKQSYAGISIQNEFAILLKSDRNQLRLTGGGQRMTDGG